MEFLTAGSDCFSNNEALINQIVSLIKTSENPELIVVDVLGCLHGSKEFGRIGHAAMEYYLDDYSTNPEIISVGSIESEG